MDKNTMDKTAVSADLEKLLSVGAHYGLVKSRRHPSARPFIFGLKNRVEIFNLEKTEECLRAARAFVSNLSTGGRQILFVGGKSEAAEAVRQGAKAAGMPYSASRWIGGTLTNFSEIRKRLGRLEDLESQKAKGQLTKYTKKERLLIDREIERLKKLFAGLTSLKKLPVALFVVDSRRETTAVREARRLKIPIVSLSGSDCDFSLIDYPIPANDASVSSIKHFVGQVVEAIKEGQKITDNQPSTTNR